MNIRNFISKYTLEIFNIIATIAIMAPMSLMYLHLKGQYDFIFSLSESLLIMLPALFIKPKWRWTTLIPIWLIGLFYLTNIWYWRFFHDLMPLASYFYWDNLDNHVIGTWISLVKLKDFGLILPGITITALYLIYFRKYIEPIGQYPKLIRVISSIFIIVLYISLPYLHTAYSDTDKTNNGNVQKNSFIIGLKSRYIVEWPKLSTDYICLNFTSYIAKQTYLELYHRLRSRNVTIKQVAVANKYLDEHSRLCNDESNKIHDSIATKRKNVIFIIVESLNAWAVNRSYSGHEVTPTLNALIKGQGTISALNMVTQVLTGVSSDGQFIYNTGMLPSSEVTTVYYYDKNKYTSLANKFKDKYSFEMICESISTWNHYNTTKAYGYDNLISDIGEDNIEMGEDGKLFKKAIEVIDTIQKPFFAELTTISMHAPFKDVNVKRPHWINQQTNLTETMRDYLTVTNYFDTQLKTFIDGLKQRGKYDDTMIFIASDHAVIVEGATDEENSQLKVVFMALNTGINAQIEQAVGQVDVYPTILDLMGEYDPSTWTGLGLSMFNPRCNGAIDKYGKVHGNNIDTEYLKHLKSAQTATNTMLRMDYFASHNNKYF